MQRTKLTLLFILAAAGHSAMAFVCYRADVLPTQVVGLKTPARLTFLAPNRPREIGVIEIKTTRAQAQTAVFWTPGPPVAYGLEMDQGRFTQGSEDGRTTLNVAGAFGVTKDDDGDDVVFVQTSTPRIKVPAQIYRLEMMTDADCKIAFPNQGR